MRGGHPALRRVLSTPDERVVFVFGCPRSGTTFLAGALGSLTGYTDLGEVAPLKAAIRELASTETVAAGVTSRRILQRVQRLSLVSGLRPIEQTPESVFIARALMDAYPSAVFLHLIRDGRDVVCSLAERGWLAASRSGGDDAGQAYGSSSRFWVEPDRAAEFTEVSDIRRAAWAWRRYVQAGRALGAQAVELRYEALTATPHDVARTLTQVLGHREDEMQAALSRAHDESVGRHREELSMQQLADVESEAGELLHTLGYVSSTGG